MGVEPGLKPTSASVRTAYEVMCAPKLQSQESETKPKDDPPPDRPWLELRGGYGFCSLCSLYATDAHLASEKHKKRQEWFDAWGTEPAETGDWGDPIHFEWREWRWWCRSCKRWADGVHVQSARHQKQVEWVEWFGYDDERNRGGHRTALCWHKVEDSTPVAQGLAEPEPWGPNWETTTDVLAKPDEAPTISWRGAYSAEHDRMYFYNSATGERTWELPDNCSIWAPQLAPDVSPDVGPAAAVAAVRHPSTWHVEWSEEHKRRYWWNQQTGESSWEPPTTSTTDTISAVDAEIEWC